MPTPMNRREFLIRSGLMGMGAMSLPAILAACGGSDTASDTTAGSGGGARSLYFENWPAYIDEETVKLFTAATGIKMKYTVAYNDNNEYFAKVQPFLAKGDKIDPDLLAPTFWMASRYVKLGWAQKLPLDKIPNAANLRTDLKNPAWDPNGEFSLPWQTGVAGIAYNAKTTGREIKSVADLFDPAFKGKIGMLTEMRDTMGLILMGEGKNIETISTFDEAAVGFEKLEKAKSDGQIRSFTGNDYMDDLNAGNFAACVAWSGDVVQLSRDNPDVKFVIPEEGGTSWYDTMIWVAGSENSDAVAEWINWCYDPANAARITASVAYMSPVAGVKDELVKLGGDAAALAESPLLFPDEATLSRLQTWGPLSEEEEAKFDEAFAKITGA
ncbi:MAG: PotD/PotF family extracellular solute-binding protein [Actinomycetota bacterium]